MIRRSQDQTIEYRCIRGGVGEVEMHHLLEGADEMYGHGRMYNLMVIEPGGTIGEHEHTGDNEIFYFLEGTGTYNDNGTEVQVGPGDVTICNDGEFHSVANTGDVPLKFIALILYS
jgi:mannose-6-phosphate isomerase-like protein (cupin superfamily)